MKEFEPTGMGNEIIQVNENCVVSFNSNPGMGISFFESDDGSSETAIVIKGKYGRNIYSILNGDYREECVKIINDGGEEKELLEIYEKNKDKQSSWSSK